MKKTILILAASTFLFGAILTSCNSPAENVENAEENLTKANEELNAANQEYLADIESYKKITAEKIEANNKSIAEFNARIESDKKLAKADYQAKITALEQKNSDMQKRIDDYQAEGKDKWEIFKAEFSQDMENLGQAFKDLAVKNTK